MCKLSETQVLNAAQAVETTAITFLTSLSLISTAEGQTITTDFKTLLTDIQGWKSGTPVDDIEQVVGYIQSGLSLLPIPAEYQAGLQIILGGLEGVLVLLGANSADTSVPANLMQAHLVAAAGEKKVIAYTGYKPSRIDKARAALGDTHIFADRYNQTWDAWFKNSGLPDQAAA